MEAIKLMATYKFTSDNEPEIKPVRKYIFSRAETQNIKLRQGWKHTIDHTSTPPKRMSVQVEE